MNDLQQNIDKLHLSDYNLKLDQYNNLIKQAVYYKEMAAVVFLYDSMKNNNITPNQNTYSLINKLHSKTIPENTNIYIKNVNPTALKPRRRIHKIMKGHFYSANYNNALKNKDLVTKYLDKNPDLINLNRIRLAKNIQKNCDISFDDSRYIITNLKRTNYISNLKKKTISISSKNINQKIIDKSLAINKNINRVSQKSIKDYFKKTN